jgi:hypothetical protein
MDIALICPALTYATRADTYASVRERVMINLLSVNTYATMAQDYIAQFDKDKCKDIVTKLEGHLSDRREVLGKLDDMATASGSDNAWNRYESADEAYAYGQELKALLEDYLADNLEYDDLTIDLEDIVNKSGRELMYRLERAQW